MTTTTKCTLIESTLVDAEYGMLCRLAIVEHPTHGRLFLREGYGGEDTLAGGAIRWRHGIAIRIQPADTLESLRGNPDGYLNLVQGFDAERPVLAWDGASVEAVARAAGL
jgi:hypothetical protein